MNASKDKGTKAETAVVAYLNANGHPRAERRALRGALDAGDIAGVTRVVIQVKNVQRMDLAGWVDEVIGQVRAFAAGADVGVVWHKRRGRVSAGEWYVTMTGADFVKLIEGRK